MSPYQPLPSDFAAVGAFGRSQTKADFHNQIRLCVVVSPKQALVDVATLRRLGYGKSLNWQQQLQSWLSEQISIRIYFSLAAQMAPRRIISVT